MSCSDINLFGRCRPVAAFVASAAMSTAAAGVNGDMARSTPLAAPRTLSRGRSIGVWSLIVLASVIGLITVLTIWVNRQLLDNDQFRKSTTELVQDPQIRGALSVYLVNQLYNNV